MSLVLSLAVGSFVVQLELSTEQRLCSGFHLQGEDKVVTSQGIDKPSCTLLGFDRLDNTEPRTSVVRKRTVCRKNSFWM